MECSKKYLEAVKIAAWRHALNSYDGEPYYVHFEDLEQVLEDHGGDDEDSKIQCQLHDLIEDGSWTYNDIKKRFGLVTAEVVYLCSDHKGRTRDDRKCQAFYDEIKDSAYRLQATKIKVADRIANARRSAKNRHGMGAKYKTEYSHFKSELYVSGHIDSMWEELDGLMYNDATKRIGRLKKKEKKAIALDGTKRPPYKRAPKRFYSTNYQSWISKTKVILDGNWYKCDLINEATGEKIEEIADTTRSRLSKRVVDYINNPNSPIY